MESKFPAEVARFKARRSTNRIAVRSVKVKSRVAQSTANPWVRSIWQTSTKGTRSACRCMKGLQITTNSNPPPANKLKDLTAGE